MIISSTTSGSEWFLDGLSRLQRQETQTQRELSSGYRVQDASDSPSQTPELVRLGSTLAQIQATQTNLGRIQTETTTADQAIGDSISLIENARSIAVQGAGSITNAADRQTLAVQVQAIQQQLVSIANTRVEGRYIFGGDQDQSAPYQSDPASLTGVTSLTTQTSSRVITGIQGQALYQGLTAQQIFDPRENDAAPASGNTFTALESLRTSLVANDQAGIASALTALESASAWVNQQQSYYGASEQRITTEQNNAANRITTLESRISTIRDTDVVRAATDLTQESTSQAAALAAQAEIPRKSLFDYLG
jgi:flagellar hook-associated protein 3 FlgL